MNNTLFVTCLYSDLYGTKFGGRPNRTHHYVNSLKNIVKNITNADFVIYTSPTEYNNICHNFNFSHVDIVQFDLDNHFLKKEFELYKNYEEAKTSDRCFEIQYSKFDWLSKNLKSPYKYIYWIDAGLSYSGLIPDKYLECKGLKWDYDDYYKSPLFNNNLVDNLNKHDEIFIITKDNDLNYWSKEMVKYMDVSYDQKWHVIGGLFGGDIGRVFELIIIIKDKIQEIIDKEKHIQWSEEQFMTLLYYNIPQLFNPYRFDTWWHNDNYPKGEELSKDEYFKTRKSFYNILEELQ